MSCSIIGCVFICGVARGVSRFVFSVEKATLRLL